MGGPAGPRATSPESRPLSPQPPLWAPRVVALFEVILCSDYPTQLALGATLNAAGFSPLKANGQLSLGYVVTLSLADTALLIGLIVLFLRSHGERLRDVFIGPRPISGEARLGVSLTLVALVIGIAVLGTIQIVVPSLHN